MPRITKIEETKATKTKIRVAAYCRVSTDFNDQLLSLETQKAHYETWIKSNPEWEYAGIYYDEGISGTKKDNRPGLLRMLADCEHGLIDFVVVKSISRLTRNTADCIMIVRKLLGLNIPIYFEKENINTSNMESELLLSIMGSLAEAESVSISENNKWGIKYRFERGTFKCSSVPFGYSWDKKNAQMVIDEEQAKAVRFIFEQTLAGVGTRDIAKKLTAMNVPTQRGGNWTGHTVNGIIRNEKYTGACLFQKTYTDSYFKRQTNFGERDQYYVEDHHEAIITEEEYEAANAVIDRRREEKNIAKETGKYAKRYPLSGKVICGECGGSFKRKTYSETGKVVLACTNHIHDKDSCSMKYVSNAGVEMAFARMMNKLIFTRNRILKPFCDALDSTNHNEALLEIHSIEEQLDALVGRKQTLKSLFAQGLIEPAVYNQELNSLITESESLSSKRDALSYKASSEIGHISKARDLLRFTEHADNLTGFDAELFDEFVEKIIIVSRTEVKFILKCGLELKERID